MDANRKSEEPRGALASRELPSWLSGEQRRRLFLACRAFTLLRKAVSTRKNIFLHHCSLRKAQKTSMKELVFRETLGGLLDDRAPIPKLSRLKMERKRLANKFFWGQRDIAIIMGKDQSNISRLLRRMKQDETWGARLRSICRATGHKESYSDGIFSLILDFCEAEYLERFTQPRRGNVLPEERINELLDAWQQVRQDMEQDAPEE